MGEFGLIEGFRKLIKTDSSVVKGSGDDCAVLKFDKDRYQLFTCDMLVEKVDFLSSDDPYLIGRKSLAISISDIAACAGLPRYCLIAIGMPGKASSGFVQRLFKGMLDISREYRINIVGGDLSNSPRLTIDVSMIGIVEKKYLVLRSGAREGDIIFVSGSLGGSIKGKHLRFVPRLKEARSLVKKFKLSSMIDISDGLLGDLGHILEESNTGAAIYEDLIPVSHQARNLEDALTCGEDFELLFTLSKKEARKLCAYKKFRQMKPIGEIMPPEYRLRLIDREGQEKNLKPQGFTHF